jgi:hypothetical protein
MLRVLLSFSTHQKKDGPRSFAVPVPNFFDALVCEKGVRYRCAKHPAGRWGNGT